MPTRTVRRVTTTVLLGASLAALTALPAAAHVTANPSTTEAGSYALVAIRVPHGCEGAATAKVEVQVPEGVVSVTPEDVPGWSATTEDGPYDEPVELHGTEVTEGVRVVTWTADDGQELGDDRFRDFGLSVRLPDAAGRTLAFPAIQTCVDGAEAAWIETSDDPDAELDMPAPTITLTGAEGDGHGAAAPSDDAEGAAVAPDTLPAAADAAGDAGGSDALVYVALGLGALGLVTGGLGLRAARAART